MFTTFVHIKYHQPLNYVTICYLAILCKYQKASVSLPSAACVWNTGASHSHGFSSGSLVCPVTLATQAQDLSLRTLCLTLPDGGLRLRQQCCSRAFAMRLLRMRQIRRQCDLWMSRIIDSQDTLHVENRRPYKEKKKASDL